jgi:mono/diheme cytochrome c family protein
VILVTRGEGAAARRSDLDRDAAARRKSVVGVMRVTSPRAGPRSHLPRMKRPRRGSLAAVAAAGSAALLWLSLREAPAQQLLEAAPPGLVPADWPLSPSEERGRMVYEKLCLGCHGDRGRGDGPAARFLDPLPRDFQSGKFKFRSTAFGELPLESDLVRTVTCGLPGSSMPGFPLVPEIERKDVVRYVLHLAKFGAADRRVLYAVAEEDASLDDIRRNELPAMREEIERAAEAVRRVSVSPEPPRTAESVERGRALFATSCASCHGARGVGDGESSHSLRDWQDAAIRPRDLTSGVFRSGSTPEDVFVRVKTGLTGTPMPGFSNLPDGQIWELVHFIQSLKDPSAAKPKMPPGCGHEGGSR